jgi:hypothetical protein
MLLACSGVLRSPAAALSSRRALSCAALCAAGAPRRRLAPKAASERGGARASIGDDQPGTACALRARERECFAPAARCTCCWTHAADAARVFYVMLDVML